MIEKMKTEKNVEWEDMPSFYKYGSFIKKEKYVIDAVDKQGVAVKAIRTRAVLRSFSMNKLTDENLNFIVSKYISDASMDTLSNSVAVLEIPSTNSNDDENNNNNNNNNNSNTTVW